MPSSSIESIRNFVQLTPRIATAGQPTATEFRAIARAGYTSVVNLAMPDHPDSIDDEGKRVTELGMSYFHLPIPYDSPTAAQVRRFCRLLASLDGEQLFVHCIMNYRVSAFMFHYLTRVEGWPQDRARSPVLDSWQPEPQWQAILNLPDSEFGAAGP